MGEIKIDPEETKKAMERGTFSAFVPHRLEVPDRPDLRRYPFNVLFMSHTLRNGQHLRGTALYEPEFHTYRKGGDISSMRYRNIYGGNCHLVITYDEKNKQYRGEKLANGKLVNSTDGGNDWHQFFVHLTMGGLVDGEKCEFELLDGGLYV